MLAAGFLGVGQERPREGALLTRGQPPPSAMRTALADAARTPAPAAVESASDAGGDRARRGDDVGPVDRERHRGPRRLTFRPCGPGALLYALGVSLALHVAATGVVLMTSVWQGWRLAKNVDIELVSTKVDGGQGAAPGPRLPRRSPTPRPPPAAAPPAPGPGPQNEGVTVAVRDGGADARADALAPADGGDRRGRRGPLPTRTPRRRRTPPARPARIRTRGLAPDRPAAARSAARQPAGLRHHRGGRPAAAPAARPPPPDRRHRAGSLPRLRGAADRHAQPARRRRHLPGGPAPPDRRRR